jgi:CBS domain containing-hemolysin-like protein
MTGWVLALTGTVVAGAGVLLATGVAATNRIELYRWASQRLGSGAPAATVLAVPGRLLGTANALAAIGLVVAGFGVMALVAPLPLWLAGLGVALIAIPAELVVAYALPRALGQRRPEPMIKSAAPWLERLGYVVAPLTAGGAAEQRPRVAVAAFLQSGEEEVDTTELLAVLSGVLTFTERPVREIMTPRTEIVAVREGARLEEVGQIFAESGYSRIPVYHESLDNIVGMIYALDLLKVTPGAELPLRPVTVAPASKRCADLLFDMQRERRQFAVVLDEYGGTAGIATFQDLLGELVAQVFAGPGDRGEGREGAVDLVEVTGTTACQEIAERFEVALGNAAETVGGLLAAVAGRIPRTGERYAVGGLEFDVLEAGPTRVERVVVRRTPVPVVQDGGRPA